MGVREGRRLRQSVHNRYDGATELCNRGTVFVSESECAGFNNRCRGKKTRTTDPTSENLSYCAGVCSQCFRNNVGFLR